MFTLDDLVEEKDWTSVCLGLESIVCSLTNVLGVLKDDITLASQVGCVFTVSTFKPCLYDSNLTFLQSLVMHSREKCLFLHCEREVWGLLPKCRGCRRKCQASRPRNRKPINTPMRPRTSSRLRSPRLGKMPWSLDDFA